MGTPPAGLPWRREQAKFAQAHLPHPKNPLVRELALLILEEYPTADPPAHLPNFRIPIAAQRASRRLEKLKSLSHIPKPVLDASLLQVTKALETATAQLEGTIEWRGRSGRYD